jgi:hypothetical protein
MTVVYCGCVPIPGPPGPPGGPPEGPPPPL